MIGSSEFTPTLKAVVMTWTYLTCWLAYFARVSLTISRKAHNTGELPITLCMFFVLCMRSSFDWWTWGLYRIPSEYDSGKNSAFWNWCIVPNLRTHKISLDDMPPFTDVILPARGVHLQMLACVCMYPWVNAPMPITFWPMTAKNSSVSIPTRDRAFISDKCAPLQTRTYFRRIAVNVAVLCHRQTRISGRGKWRDMRQSIISPWETSPRVWPNCWSVRPKMKQSWVTWN